MRETKEKFVRSTLKEVSKSVFYDKWKEYLELQKERTKDDKYVVKPKST